MTTFDVSASSAAFEQLRTVLPHLNDVLGPEGFLLIGATGRDLVAHGVAGLPITRATLDVDVSVAVSSRDAFKEHLEEIGQQAGLLTRRTVAGLPVDVLPFGAAAPHDLFVHDGLEYDVSGMAEAFETADHFQLGQGLVVRSPCLAAMIILKLVAWDIRMSTKDTADLGLLLNASWAPGYVDAIWDDDSGAEIFDFDPPVAGPYVQIRRIAGVLRASTRTRLLEILTESTELLSAQTPALIAGSRRLQYEAVAAALREPS